MTHVVFYSGGVASYLVAKRVASLHGTDRLVLLFTDTRSEDTDLCRFLVESAGSILGVDVGDLTAKASAIPPCEDQSPERVERSARTSPCSRTGGAGRRSRSRS